MPDREKVIKGLECCTRGNLCTSDCPYFKEVPMTDGKCITTVQADALALLKEQESEWLEDSDPGQEYGTTWACRKCGHSIHKPFIWNPYKSGYKYCLHCGRKMEVNLDAETST